MKRNKIFRWLYFIILLIPIMFVFLPMINNETIYKTEVKQNVNVIEYGSSSIDILPFLIDLSYQNIDNEFYYISFNDLYPYLNFYGYEFAKEEFVLGANDSNDNTSYLYGFLSTRIYDNVIVRGVEIDGSVSVGDAFSFVNDDDDDIYEGFYIDITVVSDYLYFKLDLVIMGFCDYMYTFYYKDYVITDEIVNTSIWYDFSVKMNDTFPFIGGFTEFVSDNIIDLSNNDYVFFAFTYMIYIFVISLLWLLFEFLMFIINFTHKYMERFYE